VTRRLRASDRESAGPAKIGPDPFPAAPEAPLDNEKRSPVRGKRIALTSSIWASSPKGLAARSEQVQVRTEPTIHGVASGRKRAPLSQQRRVAPAADLIPHVIPRAAWLRLAVDEADRALLRADARRNVLAIARVIGWSADPRTGRSRPTLARIMAATGLCRRTVQNWTRWLERRGLLDVLEPGTTPDYRPALLALGTGNLAREWRLTIPAVQRTCTPPVDLDLERTSSAGGRARETPETARRCAPDSTPPPSPVVPQAIPWPPDQNPQRRRDRLAAAETLRRDLPVLRRMSAVAVRSALRPHFAAGWTPADVRHALDHLPDGSPHIRTTEVHSPASWLAYRLSLWRSPDGAVLKPHSAELAARAASHQAAQDAQREQLKVVRSQAGDYPAQASIARAMLRQALADRRPPPGMPSASR
jgi:hypothetical protein